jgi:hypothetical protein
MKIFTLKIVLLFFLLNSITTFSQLARPIITPKKTCGSADLDKHLRANDPQYVINRQQLEEFIQDFVHNPVMNKTQVTIPVVVHVIHLGEAVGTGSNISDAQILSAIENLNAAYSNTSTAFTTYTGLDTEIQFCLAQQDPQGNPSTGINRVSGTSVTQYSSKGICSAFGGTGTDNEQAVKALSKWDHTNYYNFWIVSEIDDNDGGAGTQGYAYFPGAGSNVDGAVMLYNAFGYDPNGLLGYELKNYTNLNSTAIHEIGHALNLYHTFEGDDPNGDGVTTCPTTTNGCGSDLGDCCADVPPHKRSESDCVVGTNSCTGSANDLFMHNFMDYSSDLCQSEFSSDQTNRMQAVLANFTASGRGSLTNSVGCNPSNSNFDASISSIISPNETFCQTTFSPQVTLRNFGLQTLTSATITSNIDGGTNQNFSWTGSLASGASETVTLNSVTTTNGNHIFTASSSNPNGNSDEFTLNDASTVNFNISSSNPIPFVEDFEGTFPPNGWTNISEDVASGSAWDVEPSIREWESRNVSAESDGTSGKAAAYNAFAYNTNTGSIDELTSPSIDLSNTVAPFLEFEVSYQYYGSQNFEQLRVLISTDCGITFVPVYTKSFDDLATNGQGQTTWAPTSANDWRLENIDLSAFAGSVISVKFEATNGYGNNLYIDKINIDDICGPPTVTSPPSDASSCSGGNVSFSIQHSGTVTYQWQENTGSGFVDINNGGMYAGSTTDNLTISGIFAGMDNYLYRCVLSSTCGNTTSTSASLNISASVTPNITILSNDVDNIFCSGTSVNFNATPTNGGTTPSYQWKLNGSNVGTNSITYSSSSFSNGDVITCVITSSDACANPTSVTSNAITVNVIASPATPIITANGPLTICQGESVTLSSSYANGNSWSSGENTQNVTVSTSDSYSVTVSQNGCSSTSIATIVTVNPIPNPSLSNINDVCENSSAFNLTQGTPSGGVYTVNGVVATNFTPSSSNVGTNTVVYTLTQNGCSGTETTTFDVNPTPVVSISSISNICDTAAAITLNQGTPSGGTYLGNGVTGAQFTPNQSLIGQNTITYSVTQNGCVGSASTILTVENCSGAGLEENNIVFNIFPNPTTGIIQISGLLSSEINQILVFDKNGKVVFEAKNTNQLDLRTLSNGNYQLLIKGLTFEKSQQIQIMK